MQQVAASAGQLALPRVGDRRQALNEPTEGLAVQAYSLASTTVRPM